MAQDKLTSKQEHFAQLVSSGHTYSDAYRQAYNVGAKTKKETIWRKSSEVMEVGKVSARVQELREQKYIKLELEPTLEEIILKMSIRLRMDIRSFYDENGAFKNIHDLTEDQAMCLNEIETRELFSHKKNGDSELIGFIKKIKFIDLQSLWDKFMKKFGAYVQDENNKSSDLDAIRELVKELKK